MRKIILAVILLLVFAPIAMGQQAYRFSAIGDIGNKGASGHDVRAYGAADDGSTDAEPQIASAITAAAGGIVIFSQAATSYRISSNVTVPSGTTAVFQEGGPLSIDNGIVFAVAQGATLIAGNYQIFSGAGTVTLGTGSVNAVNPMWWGAFGDDSTDCAAAINAALDAITGIGKMVIPPGIYRTTVSIDSFPVRYSYQNPNQIIMEGSGRADTIIKYMGTSGYAIETHNGDTSEAAVAVTQTRLSIKHMTIRAENLSAAGGCILSMGHHNRFEDLFLQTIPVYGTAYKQQRRTYKATESSFTNDTDLDFTSSGGGATEKFAIAYTTAGGLTGRSRAITVRLGKTGAPAGTVTISLYTDAAGPNTLVGGASQAVNCNDLSAAADGADQEFVIEWEESGAFTAATKFWWVIETSGYTYADGVTEVRLRVESGAGAANTFATYSGAWALSADGANYIVENALALSVINFANGMDIPTSSSNTYSAVGVNVAEDSQLMMTECNVYSNQPIYSIGTPWLVLNKCNIDQGGATNYVVNWTGISGGTFDATNSYFEGGSNTYPIHLGKVSRGNFISSVVVTPVDYTPGYGEVTYYGRPVRFIAEDSNMPPPDNYSYRVYTPDTISGKRSLTLVSGTVAAVDADALTENAWNWVANNDSFNIVWAFPPGVYRVTTYAKATTPDGSDLNFQVRENTAGGSLIDAVTVFGVTAAYAPHAVIVRWPASSNAQMYIQWASRNVGDVFISHVTIEYICPLTPGTNNITLFNAEEGDADGDRATSVDFHGFQSGGEQSLLAKITASHDGATDDEKGELELKVNLTSDSFDPTTLFSLDSDSEVTTIGEPVLQPSTTQVINAVGDAILADAGTVVIDPDADYILTSTPHMADGTTGQIVYVTAGNAEANSVTLQDQDALGGSNVQLLNNASSREITGKSTASFRFDGTDWIEFGGAGPGGAPTSHTLTLSGFTGAEEIDGNITGVSSSDPVITFIECYISNDPAGDEDIQFVLGFYRTDSHDPVDLIVEYMFNITYTETNGGVANGETTDTVDTTAGLTKGDYIFWQEDTEYARLTAVPTATGITFSPGADGAKADDTGVVRVTRIANMFKYEDSDESSEIHIKGTTLSAPTATMNVLIIVEVQ